MNVKQIRNIVELELGIDMHERSRRLTIVDARRIYAQLAKMGRHSLKDIGNEINKDHTTIIHYLQTFDGLLRDKAFADKYLRCKVAYFEAQEKFQKEFAHYNQGLLKIEKRRLEIKLEKINDLLNK